MFQVLETAKKIVKINIDTEVKLMFEVKLGCVAVRILFKKLGGRGVKLCVCVFSCR